MASAAGVISLRSLYLNCLYHYQLLLSPYASRGLGRKLKPALAQLQQEILDED